MYELPLFPLNTVLLPGTPIRLHIFEERYKRMISHCIQTQQPFGIVLIRRGVEALGPLAEPYYIGCSADVVHVQQLEEGRMNIAAIGRERFRILTLDRHAHPYLMSTVENFPVICTERDELSHLTGDLRYWVNCYLGVLANAGVGHFTVGSSEVDPVKYAYSAISILQLTALQKQQILSISLASQLVVDVISNYRREIAILKTLLSRARETHGAFSHN